MSMLVARYFGYDARRRAAGDADSRWPALMALLFWSGVSALLWTVILTAATAFR